MVGVLFVIPGAGLLSSESSDFIASAGDTAGRPPPLPPGPEIDRETPEQERDDELDEQQQRQHAARMGIAVTLVPHAQRESTPHAVIDGIETTPLPRRQRTRRKM